MESTQFMRRRPDAAAAGTVGCGALQHGAARGYWIVLVLRFVQDTPIGKTPNLLQTVVA
jgi:hypothetical protein